MKVCFEALNNDSKAIRGAHILILGLADKANVDDDRESPTYKLIEKLENLGASVEFHDPYVPVIPKTREHAEYAGRKSVEKISDQYHLILSSTCHDEYKAHHLSTYKAPIFDTRNCVSGKSAKYYKA